MIRTSRCSVETYGKALSDSFIQVECKREIVDYHPERAIKTSKVGEGNSVPTPVTRLTIQKLPKFMIKNHYKVEHLTKIER